MDNLGSINRHISLIYRFGRRFLSRELKQINIDVGQYPFLMVILNRPDMTQEQLSDFLGMDRGVTARSVAALEAQGLIIRKVDKLDKRVNHIYPTDKAIALSGEIFKISHSLHEVFLDGFSNEEKQQISDYILRIEKNIRRKFDNE